MTDDAMFKELLTQVHEINKNVVYFINMFRYEGKYDYIEESVSPQTQKHKILFGFPAKKIIIRATQGITINLNDRRNPGIKVNDDEYPYELELVPGLLVDRIYVTTYDNDTTIRITIMG